MIQGGCVSDDQTCSFPFVLLPLVNVKCSRWSWSFTPEEVRPRGGRHTGHLFALNFYFVFLLFSYKIWRCKGGALPAGGEAEGAAAHRGGLTDICEARWGLWPPDLLSTLQWLTLSYLDACKLSCFLKTSVSKNNWNLNFPNSPQF